MNDGQNFFHKPVKTDMKTYNNNQKVSASHGDA